jgi:hypothetical protein
MRLSNPPQKRYSRPRWGDYQPISETIRMIVELTDPATRRPYRRKVTLDFDHARSTPTSPILQDAEGGIYGAGDWANLRGRVIHAAPHERSRFPQWMYWFTT